MVSSAGCSAAGAVASVPVLDLGADRPHRHGVRAIPDFCSGAASSTSKRLGSSEGTAAASSARFAATIENSSIGPHPERVSVAAGTADPETSTPRCARRTHANHRDRDEQSASNTSGRHGGVFFNSCPQNARIGAKTGIPPPLPSHRQTSRRGGADPDESRRLDRRSRTVGVAGGSPTGYEDRMKDGCGRHEETWSR